MTRLGVIPLAFAILIGPGVAQTVTDLTVPWGPFSPTMGSFVATPVFGDASSCAIGGPDEIHVWNGLAASASYSNVPLTGAQGMFTTWQRIAPDVAVYRSRGTDLAPGTSDDELIMVRGLPSSPQLVPTGLFNVWTGGLERVNDGVAVDFVAAGARVLAHDATGATLQTIGFSWVQQAFFTGGRVDDDTIAVLGPGPDMTDRTTDDELVLVRGLATGGPYNIETWPLPLTGIPDGSLVTEDGTLVVLRNLGLPVIEVMVAQPAGPGVPPTVHTLTVNTNATALSNNAYSMSAATVPQGGLVVGSDDDNGVGYVLLGGLTATPAVRWTWYDDFFVSAQTWPVHEDEVLTFHPANIPNPVNRFDYIREDGAGPQLITVPLTTTATFPLIHHDTVRLSRGALAFLYNESGSFGQCRVAIVRDTFAGDVVDITPPIYGHWIRVFPLGPGRVGGLLSTTPGDYGPDTLRIVSAPHAITAELTHPGGFAPIQLTYTPSTPSITQSFQIDVLVSPSLNASYANLVFTVARLPEAVSTPGVSGLLAIDPAAIVGDFVVPLTAPGIGQLAAPANSVPPALADVPFWLQSYVVAGGGVHLSDLGLVILGA